MTIDLTGRKALVTGGARGIRAGIVRAMAACGARVSFTGLGSERGRQAAELLVDDLSAMGHQVHYYTATAQDLEAMKRVTAEAAEKMQGLDIVVPNAGANWVAPVEALDLAGWQRAIDNNLTSGFIAVRVALPWLLKAPRADIVFIGSSAVFDGGGGGAHYAAAKAGLDG